MTEKEPHATRFELALCATILITLAIQAYLNWS
jgi:hypothetical protein